MRSPGWRSGDSIAAPQLDLEALAQLPPGSFGRAVADFCEANAIVVGVAKKESGATPKDRAALFSRSLGS